MLSISVLGESILNVLGCLAPFLEYDLLDTLPYIVASALAVFPDTLQSEVVELLCTNLLPITLGQYSDRLATVKPVLASRHLILCYDGWPCL